MSSISALTIAEALEMPSPTSEQQAVIEAPLAPTLVVAGAGSGKTETMANRVLWLLANGHARPDQILGLTFTRKAAGELGARINKRIGELDEAKLLPAASTITESEPVSDLFNTPTVSTYNSFASRLFSDNALLLGREPESALLTETSAWLLARRVVIDHGDDRLVSHGKKLDEVTDAVLQLSRMLAENPPPARLSDTVPSHDLEALAAGFGYLADLPYGSARKSKPYDSVVDALAAVQPLPVLAELADHYQQEKRRLGLIEFSDQVALALQLAQKVPTIVERAREQYKIVLLDEYQDTSVLQTELLSTLFAHHSVMAVGDPHQSIYGWRGASSANLLGFSRDFAGKSNADAPAMSLSYTWRNPVAVLGVANELVAPLSEALRAKPNGIQVDTLKVPAGKAQGHVSGGMFETISDEASAIARWFAERLPADTDKTAAMLFRARRDMEFFAEVLREHGVKAHVLGLGGLLSTPEISDIVSVLRAVHDPAAGSELIRLLTGGRWRIGPRDLHALSDVARELATHDWAQRAVSAELKEKLRASVAGDETSSLVDALDFVATAPAGHRWLEGFSDEGLARLREAGRQLAWFRSRAGLPLLDFVRLIEQELLLDIELVANETRSLGLANLYAFHDAISAFLDSDEQGTLGSFLRWLKRAERQDELGPRTEPAEAGTVQLLTIHGSKGLEWDFVAIPSLAENSLPAKAKEGAGWLRFGELPYPCRGDRDELPQLRWAGHDTQKEFDEEFATYKAEIGARHDAEERRLIYVATTRSQDELLLTASFWANGKLPRKPSRYLVELAEAGLIAELQQQSTLDEKPEMAGDGSELWPFDPLGSRRPVVEAAAALVWAAADSADSADAEAVVDAADQGHETSGYETSGRETSGREPASDAGSPWSDDVTLLLRERAARQSDVGLTALPTRIPASRFKDYVDNPYAVAAALRRPMPQKPYRATRLGTLFHSWVEQRSGDSFASDLIDAGMFGWDIDVDSADIDSAEDEAADSMRVSGDLAEAARFEEFKATFERSQWANQKPEEVEIEIHHVMAGQVFICKLDAVYRTATGYQVVDWKTGKAPKNAADLELKQTQLALYRLAYARWKGIDPELVDAVFYFVADDTIIAPERLYSEDDLREAWSSVRAAVSAPAPAPAPASPSASLKSASV